MTGPKYFEKFLKDLQENLTCEVCKEEYDDQNRKPHILPCYHSFCIRCLQLLVKHNGYHCPTCRHKFPPHYSFPVDSKTVKILDLVREHRHRSDSAAADKKQEEKEQQLGCILKEMDEEDETWECSLSNFGFSPAFQGEPDGERNEQLHQERRFIWKGRLIFTAKPRPASKQRVGYSLKCFLTINKGDPSINASHWPNSMKVDLVHWQVALRLGVCDKSQRVAFHFSLPNFEPLRRLSQFLNSSGHVGCILFPKMSQTTVRGLILTFDVRTQAFIGYIPNNQEEFEQEVTRELLISEPKLRLKPRIMKRQPQPSTSGFHQRWLGPSPAPQPAVLGLQQTVSQLQVPQSSLQQQAGQQQQQPQVQQPLQPQQLGQHQGSQVQQQSQLQVQQQPQLQVLHLQGQLNHFQSQPQGVQDQLQTQIQQLQQQQPGQGQQQQQQYPAQQQQQQLYPAKDQQWRQRSQGLQQLAVASYQLLPPSLQHQSQLQQAHQKQAHQKQVHQKQAHQKQVHQQQAHQQQVHQQQVHQQQPQQSFDNLLFPNPSFTPLSALPGVGQMTPDPMLANIPPCVSTLIPPLCSATVLPSQFSTFDLQICNLPPQSSNPVSIPTHLGTRPSNLALQPTSLDLQSFSLTSQPFSLTSQPFSLTSQPFSLTSQPFSLTPQLTNLGSQSSSLAPQPYSLTPQSTHLAPQSTNLAPQPYSLTPQSTNLAPQSTNSGPQSSNLVPQSTNLAPQSTNLAPQSYSLTPQSTNPGPQSTNLALQSSNLAPQSTSLAPQSYSLTPQSTNPGPQSTNLALQSSNLAPQSANLGSQSSRPPSQASNVLPLFPDLGSVDLDNL